MIQKFTGDKKFLLHNAKIDATSTLSGVRVLRLKCSFRRTRKAKRLMTMALSFGSAPSSSSSFRWSSLSTPSAFPLPASTFFPRKLKASSRFCQQQELSIMTTSEDSSFGSPWANVDTHENSMHRVKGLPVQTSYSLSAFSGRSDGKPGFISFHGYHYLRNEVETISGEGRSRILWFAAPTVLVAFLVFPLFYLRKILSTFFEDSLFTDFLILFFTEALFYTGVAIFVMLIDVLWRPIQTKLQKKLYVLKIQGLRLTSVVTSAMPLIIPLLTMGLVWPWTGPAASATLAPYLVGVVVQFSFEQYASRKTSPALPVIPIIFHVYRLHQLNRAAQLVSALSFSVRGTEITSHTTAISNSLGVLFTVLQILGVISIWSLSSFLMRFLPPSEAVF
ncbi:hypothetical protein ZIOFF_037591 [Zingiber officinale]|uniref:Uncharacterized protein n=1 Tax=Zingiber officinale TaxID=94328 RepID=A0A8J5GKM7_ZINOF|nr:hypothetical protein ZIOFF_037591 [Zingiber officinale]